MAYINYGCDYGKQVVVVDVSNENSIMVDGPNFPRGLVPLRRLNLTRIKLAGIKRGCRTGTLKKAIAKQGLTAKWANTPVAKKLAAQATRANLTDLQRFQVMINRKRRSFAVRKLAAKAGAAPAKGGAAAGKKK